MNKHFDAIVLGVGSMGSATCYYLASRGLSVLGIEQFDIPHDQGSHAGQSRIIRKAYFEHADYVPLLERAYKNWSHLERITGAQVYYPTGLFYAGKANEVLIKGVRESAAKYNLKVDSLTKEETKARFPQFRIPDNYHVLHEPDAGFLIPERAILLYVEQAIRAGAQIHSRERVTSWSKEKEDITVSTQQGVYTCKKLVITAGPWAGHQIPGFSSKLRVTRQVIAWVNPKEWGPFELGKFPCWMIDNAPKNGMYYGFPVMPVGQLGGPIGLKVAIHFPGQHTNPDAVNRTVSREEEQEIVNAIGQLLPNGYSTTHAMKTCLYTNSPDEHFVIDLLPGFNGQVAIAAGFSGHGFKFASAVGEIMADLAMAGKTELPIEFLNSGRFTKGATK